MVNPGLAAWMVSNRSQTASARNSSNACRISARRNAGSWRFWSRRCWTLRSANLMDLAAGLPREADRTDLRYQWITRLLGNPRVLSDAIMEPDPGSVQAVGSAPGADAG